MSDAVLDDRLPSTGKVKLELFPVPSSQADRLASNIESPENTDPMVGRDLPRQDQTVRSPGRDLESQDVSRGLPQWPTPPDYAILAELGRGGMGVVYLARQRGLNRVVALKMISVHRAADHEEGLARFHAEAKAAAHLHHPNIVQIYDVGDWQGLPFFSMEYLEGGSLDRVLQRRPQSPHSAAKLVAALARAAHHAHVNGVIHRDIKPSNVLLALDGTPKISDFGLAKRLDETGSTKTGEIMGTPSYMAPEQAGVGTDPVGPATDVYSLGALLYEMLTGRPPFLGATSVETVLLVRCQDPVPPRRLQPGTPRDLETICLKCLEKSPQRRYATALALAEDLDRFQAREPIQARPTSVGERAWKWAGRRPALAALAAVSCLALLALALLTIHHILSIEHERFMALTNQRTAEAAAQFARDAYAEAERERVKAEELRKVADANYQLARQAIDELIKTAREHPQMQLPESRELRKALTQTGMTYYEALSKQPPRDPALRSDQGRACWRLADFIADYGKKDDSIRFYEQALEIFTGLAKEDPASPQHRFNVVQTYVNIGYMHFECGRPKQAGPYFKLARERLDELLSIDRQNPDYLHVFAKIQSNEGAVAVQLGELDRADEHLTAAVKLDRLLVSRYPRENRYVVKLAIDLNELGVFFRARGSLAEAEAAHREAYALYSDLAASSPTHFTYRQALARGHGYLGFLYRKRGLLALAEKEHWQAINIMDALNQESPLAISPKSDLGMTYNDLGSIYQDRGEHALAASLYQRAAEFQSELVSRDPGNLQFRVSFAGSECNLAHALVDDGQADRALEHYGLAASTLEEVLRIEPGLSRARLFLRNAYWGRASLHQKRKEYAAALKDWDRALELDSGGLSTSFRLKRAHALAKLGRHEEAVKNVEAVLSGPGDSASVYYQAAVVFALVAEGASDIDQPSSDQAAERAVKLLERARQDGYFESASRKRLLEADPDLKSLRGRPDFKSLLAPAPTEP